MKKTLLMTFNPPTIALHFCINYVHPRVVCIYTKSHQCKYIHSKPLAESDAIVLTLGAAIGGGAFSHLATLAGPFTRFFLSQRRAEAGYCLAGWTGEICKIHPSQRILSLATTPPKCRPTFNARRMRSNEPTVSISRCRRRGNMPVFSKLG